MFLRCQQGKANGEVIAIACVAGTDVTTMKNLTRNESELTAQVLRAFSRKLVTRRAWQ